MKNRANNQARDSFWIRDPISTLVPVAGAVSRSASCDTDLCGYYKATCDCHGSGSTLKG